MADNKEKKIKKRLSDIKLKSNFLGPKSENGDWLEESINFIFSDWCSWRRECFPNDGPAIEEKDKKLKEYKLFQKYLFGLQKELSSRFEEEVPKYSPRYMGHMVSELSLSALFGHIIALLHNPNNTSYSSSKVGIKIEEEAIQYLAQMVGYEKNAIGHFTSGGTVANIEALLRSRYHLDKSLAIGTFLCKEGLKNYSLFEAAHLEKKEFRIDDNAIEKYSTIINGPYITAKYYNDIFNLNYEGPVLLVPAYKHFSWPKAMSLMGLSKESMWVMKIDIFGHVCIDDLKAKIKKAIESNRPIMGVISVVGTTEIGMFDSVDKIQDVLDDYKKRYSYDIWHHVDGAYGGVYCSMIRGKEKFIHNLSPRIISSLHSIHRVNSITLDPHKLGMVPYSCGAIIFKDSSYYKISQFDAPYLLENNLDKDKWHSTLEGSRAATGACATWMVAKSLELNQSGMGRILSLGIEAKRKLENLLFARCKNIRLIPETDSNILAFTFGEEGGKISESNKITKFIYNKIIDGRHFSVSKTSLNKKIYHEFINNFIQSWHGIFDVEEVILIRMVIMNPFTLAEGSSVDYLLEFVNYVIDLRGQYEKEVNNIHEA